MTYRLLGLTAALSLLAAGCGGSSAPQVELTKGRQVGADSSESMGTRVAREAEARGPDKVAEARQPRKIIYTASIDLLVDDIDQTDKDIRQLVGEQQGAYVAKAEVRGSPGARRTGSLTVRVPVGQFEAFRQALAKLGEVQRETLDSQDVTDQFYDLDARIKNNVAEEESLRKLLDKAAAGKLEDYLAVRDKLRQVTAELDVQKGQLQRLDKLSALATVTIALNERKSYVRPETPAFGTRIGRTFGGSIESLVDFGQGLVLVLVALVPWLPVIVVVVAPAWMWLRRRRRRAVPVVGDVSTP
jgi:Domain of unknown function (DUF4349)